METTETLMLIEEKRKQIAELKAEIAQLKSPKLANLVQEKPKGKWFSGTAQSDEWKDFITIARRLHSTPGMAMPKLEALSREQMELSAKMLDEMIPIYNKYWSAIHERK